MQETETKSSPGGSARRHTTQLAGQPRVRGVHHLVLNTDDLRKTLDFYVRILGFPLVHGMLTPGGAEESAEDRGNPPYSHIPHYFFDMGNDSLLAFFEFPKGKEPNAHRNAIGGLQHLAFACDARSFKILVDRLQAQGLRTFGPVVIDRFALTSVYFFDPNGVRLEFVADMANESAAVEVVRRMTLSPAEMREELAKVSNDTRWIEDMVDATLKESV